MYTYTAYGLAISSEIALSQFLHSSEPPQVRVYLNAEAPSLLQSPDDGYHFEATDEEAFFWFKGVGAFMVRRGVEVEVVPCPDGDQSLIPFYVQGMIMAMLLYQRGMCVLHASVIEVEHHAVAFLGHVGFGKSSIAAALNKCGYALVSDDNAAIAADGGELLVHPAYPCVKLFPATALLLDVESENLRVMHPSVTKLLSSTQRFSRNALPLGRIYVLHRDQEPAIKLLSQQQAMLEIIRHSVPTRWGAPGDAVHFRLCERLAKSVPVFSLRTFDTLSSLETLTQGLREHLLTFRPLAYA